MIKEIKFTDNALKQIGNLLSKKDKGSFFRIAIKGGGCSGFQYEFTFEQSKNDDDLNYENILIDKTSADLLKGSQVDYVSELIGESFKISNPQTKSSCGCGVSFSLLMIISSWNVNSVRARIENIKSYLLKYKPDVLMMQEIKTEDVNFPYDDFSAMDYESHVFGQKSYNGVAIISKKKLNNVRIDLIKDKLKQSRIISAEIEHKKKNIQLINIYTPNGNPVDTEKYDYKKNWMDQLIKQLKSLSKKNSNIILAGDFNVIPAAEDVYNVKSFEDDALYRLEIRKKFREMLNLGFSDVYRHFNEDKEGYTFWDYMRGAWQKNNGMRIDHFLVSNSIIDTVKEININKDPRGREKPSDHTPIEIKLA